MVGFKKIKFYTNENVGSGELDLPEQQMHTTSYWLTLPRQVMATLPYSLEDRRDGIVGLAFAMRQVAQLLLMCDRQDIGISIGAGDEGPAVGPPSPSALARQAGLALQDLDEPRVHDDYPGGHRVQRAAVCDARRDGGPHARAHRRLSLRSRLSDLCWTGGETGPEAKPVALLILDRMTGRRAG